VTAPVPSTVAIIDLDKNEGSSLRRALDLIGGVDDLNNAGRSVVVKVGVYHPATGQHTSVGVVDAITASFYRAPRIYLAESDNYRGTGSERLQVWKNLFTDRVVPFNLSEDKDTREVEVANEKIGFSHILFKPNVLVSTHALRRYDKGTILKNLLGLIPDRKKARFHKKLAAALLDTYEAIGGIDLAVIDATHTYSGPSAIKSLNTDVLVIGRDAVAVETIGAVLVGLDPKKMSVIQEAINRGLGEGDVANIEVLGISIESLKERFRRL